ncbi:protein ImuB [Cryobacterium mesophilum]|uniref:DNA polymerase Y family protein n=1 Tax=Terrimesophilobacter mesophilus TaxID=433647 RepID=A0A4R8V8S5_9MICO|nr:DNA polymerase Y family protein [Terrimesophilobacter mesophilus]MBB5631978.1 protein ImuB [Terrimesophilobacter mesophilus]TFB78875.1 DNA polymerase Y family protein [Terrimesophilobacter mesophilus]
MSSLAPDRVMLVWCPDWPVEAAIRLHGHTAATPIAVIQTGRVYACSAPARAQGVSRGLKLREAQARCPALLVTPWRPEDDARAFEPVLVAIEELMPGVEALRPGVCAIRARGPAAYYGGEEEAALWLLDRLDELGVLGTRIGIADGVFTAEQAARQRPVQRWAQRIRTVPAGAAAEYLAPLPISVLEDAPVTTLLRRLGVYTLGDFAALAAGDVRDRLGEQGARLHALSGGLDSRPVVARTPPDDLDCSIDFEPAVDRIDQVAFGVRALADRFVAGLTAARLVCTSLCVELEAERGELSVRTWLHPRSFTASDVVDRVRWQLQGGASEVGLLSGIVSVRLSPASVDSIGNHEEGLFGGGPDERIHHALSRVQGMLGRQAVLTGAVGGGRGPADRATLVPWGDRLVHEREPSPPWPGRLPDPAPSTVFEPPRPVTVFSASGDELAMDDRGALSAAPSGISSGPSALHVAAWAGPWTVDEQWWDPQHASRVSRLQVVDTTGTAWLLALEHGRWWAEGRYD